MTSMPRPGAEFLRLETDSDGFPVAIYRCNDCNALFAEMV